MVGDNFDADEVGAGRWAAATPQVLGTSANTGQGTTEDDEGASRKAVMTPWLGTTMMRARVGGSCNATSANTGQGATEDDIGASPKAVMTP